MHAYGLQNGFGQRPAQAINVLWDSDWAVTRTHYQEPMQTAKGNDSRLAPSQRLANSWCRARSELIPQDAHEQCQCIRHPVMHLAQQQGIARLAMR
jgi:hypothetical protein